MRIISGSERGRRLFAPAGDETRPTSDRVRESLFDIIREDVPDAVVLDLFAGSGALALEALSRGAKHAVLCDRSPQAMSVIRRNVDLTRTGDRTTLIQGDWKRAADAEGPIFTLVFFDPPYRMTRLYAEAAQRLAQRGRLRPGALIVMEHDASDPPAGLPDAMTVVDERRYRDTALTFLRYTPKESGDKQ